MKNIENAYWLCITTIILILSFSSQASTKNQYHLLSEERLLSLTQQLEQYVDNQQLSGGVVLIKHQGQDVYFNAFGQQNIEANIAMKKDTIFRIASQTKAIVSVAVMMLQEQGKLLIQDPVSRYLPEFKTTYVAEPDPSKPNGYRKVKARRQITIRDLLMHTSGIGYGYGLAQQEWQQAGIQGWYFSGSKTPMREVVKEISTLPQESQPGAAFVYGYSTDILGVVVEEVTGMPLSQYLGQQIFKPLQMKDTHFYLPKEKHNRLATVYSAGPDGKIIKAPEGAKEQAQGLYHASGTVYSAGAGLVSTAADYGRFLELLLNKGKLDGQRILSAHSIELMTKDHLYPITYPWEEGVGFGLGFSITKAPELRGVPSFTNEYGWGGAYHSTYWVDPSHELIVVYLSQLIPAKNIDDHQQLRALIYQTLK